MYRREIALFCLILIIGSYASMGVDANEPMKWMRTYDPFDGADMVSVLGKVGPSPPGGLSPV